MLSKERDQPLHGMQGNQPKIFRSRHTKRHGTTPSEVEERRKTRWMVNIKSTEGETNAIELFQFA